MPFTMTRRLVSFTVLGIPEPKGSTKAYVPFAWAKAAVAAGKAPRAIITSDNPDAKKWQARIAEEAQAVTDGTLLLGALRVAVIFRLPRPASAPRRVVHHLTTPDLDKLSRLVLDGMTGVLYADDKAVVDLRARKQFARGGTAPGADITVGELEDPLPEQTAFDLFSEEV